MPYTEGPEIETDIAIIGAGVLGVSIAYWLEELYDCRVLVIDKESAPARHASLRNTGVIHRPFYLNPESKRVFALTSLISHSLWEKLAESRGLPWRPVGTLSVAVRDEDLGTLELYRKWGLENGMSEEELALLDGKATAALEREVRCLGSLLSRTDVSVDFARLTRSLMELTIARGASFLGGTVVESVEIGRDVRVIIHTRRHDSQKTIRARYLVNAAGGGSLEIAHSMGTGLAYSSLNFRGEYWVVDDPFASRIGRNVYTPPRHPQFPFLDPHFVVRADGLRQIGPNAVMVPGPYVYRGLGLRSAGDFLSPPLLPKIRLLANTEFLSLVSGEWKSSLSKWGMCDRVRKFIPGLSAGMLRRRAVFGVRSSIVDMTGFVPEAIFIRGEKASHVINYNSPGATGAPSFSAMVVNQLASEGYLDGLTRKPQPPSPMWDLRSALGEGPSHRQLTG